MGALATMPSFPRSVRLLRRSAYLYLLLPPVRDLTGLLRRLFLFPAPLFPQYPPIRGCARLTNYHYRKTIARVVAVVEVVTVMKVCSAEQKGHRVGSRLGVRASRLLLIRSPAAHKGRYGLRDTSEEEALCVCR